MTHPALPVTPLELAEAAREAREAGADAVHMHPRDATGRESLSAVHIGGGRPRGAAVVSRVSRRGRARACGYPAETSRRGARPYRAGPRSEPQDRPDFASVNLAEEGFRDLWQDLRRLGVGVEAGVLSVDDADALAATGLECAAGARRDHRRLRGTRPCPGHTRVLARLGPPGRSRPEAPPRRGEPRPGYLWTRRGSWVWPRASAWRMSSTALPGDPVDGTPSWYGLARARLT